MFFQLLRLHHDIVDALFIADGIRGRACFVNLVAALKRNWNAQLGRYSDATDPELLNEVCVSFFGSNERHFVHYFTNLHSLTTLVDRSLSQNKAFYAGLIGAQLSSDEKVLLFYYCLSNHGRQKLKPLAERYALLRSLPFGSLLSPEHAKLFGDEAYAEEVQ